MTDFLTTGEVARLANVSDTAVRLWEAAGRLRCLRTERGQRVFLRGDVDRWLAQRKADAEEVTAIGA